MVRATRRLSRARCTVRMTDPPAPHPRTCAFAVVAANIGIASRMICPAEGPIILGRTCWKEM